MGTIRQLIILILIPFLSYSQGGISINGGLLPIKTYRPSYNIDGFLPDTIPVAIGSNTTLYNDNIFYSELKDSALYSYSWTCAKGSANNKGWSYTGDIAGNYALIVECKSKGRVVDRASTIIAVTAKQTFQDTILSIGNSLTHLGYNYQLEAVFTELSDTLITIGTQTTGGYNHEGYASYTWRVFYNNTFSPFVYETKLNFTAYLTDHSYNEPQIVRIFLGINDCYGSRAMDDIIADTKIIVDSIIIDMPNALIVVALPTSCENTGVAWLAGHGTLTAYERYRLRIRDFRRRIYNKYGNRLYNANVVTDYSGIAFDRYNGYPQIDGVVQDATHPSEIGYNQIGKSLYNTLNYYK